MSNESGHAPSTFLTPEGGDISNSTTPRSSMEHRPPPPPHLLHSDDDDMPPPPPPAPEGGGALGAAALRARSVADSVKALQNSGHMPCSPRSLRRAQSVGGARATPPPPQQSSQQQIYAPVAHLQQKIQQRQQHFNQQQQMQQHQNLMQMTRSSGGTDPQAGEQYGFGLQFQHSQSQYYQQMIDAGLPMLSPPELSGQGSSYGTANHEQVNILLFPRFLF
jgi:hypothetical protein